MNPQEWGFPVDVCKYSKGACLSTSWTCCSLPAQPVRPDLLLAMFTQACKRNNAVFEQDRTHCTMSVVMLRSYFQKHITVKLRAHHLIPDGHVESIMNGIFHFSDISIYWFMLHSNWSACCCIHFALVKQIFLSHSVLSTEMPSDEDEDEQSSHCITSRRSLRSKSDMPAHVMAMTSSAGWLLQTCGWYGKHVVYANNPLCRNV